MTATVMIGKKEYPLAPLVFDQMERAWPFLKKHSNVETEEQLLALTQDDLAQREMQSSRDSIHIISIAMESSDLKGTPLYVEMPAPPVDETDEARYTNELLRSTAKRAFLIRRQMLAGEIPLIRTTILQLLQDSGLVDLGNAQMEVDQFLVSLQDQIGSTETLTSLLGSSSQPESKAETGTA